MFKAIAASLFVSVPAVGLLVAFPIAAQTGAAPIAGIRETRYRIPKIEMFETAGGHRARMIGHGVWLLEQ